MTPARRSFFLVGLATRPPKRSGVGSKAVYREPLTIWPANPLARNGTGMSGRRYGTDSPHENDGGAKLREGEQDEETATSSSAPQFIELQPRPKTQNLFEDDSEEYHLSLPELPRKPFHSPWPSIFPPKAPSAKPTKVKNSTASSSSTFFSPSTSSSSREPPLDRFDQKMRHYQRRKNTPQHTRDLLRYIVYEPDIQTATAILSDLREIGVIDSNGSLGGAEGIKKNRVYIRAAEMILKEWEGKVLAHARSGGGISGSASSTQQNDTEFEWQKEKRQAQSNVLHWLRLCPPIRGSLYSPYYALSANRFNSTLLRTFSANGIHEEEDDLKFLGEVLKCTAQEGSLPAFFPGIMTFLVYRMGVARSHVLLNEIVQIWMSTQITSTERNSQKLESNSASSSSSSLSTKPDLPLLSVLRHTNSFRNIYLRCLLRAGYKHEAKDLYGLGEKRGIVWEERTKWALVKALRVEKERDEVKKVGDKSKETEREAGEEQAEEDGLDEDADGTVTTDQVSAPLASIRSLLQDHIVRPSQATFEALPLSIKVRKLAKSYSAGPSDRTDEDSVSNSSGTGSGSGGPLPVRHLVKVMMELEFVGRGEGSGLWKRLKGRFAPSSSNRPRRLDHHASPLTSAGSIAKSIAPKGSFSASYWYLASILQQRELGRHAEAVRIFRDKFVWMGLPSLGDFGGEVVKAVEELDFNGIQDSSDSHRGQVSGVNTATNLRGQRIRPKSRQPPGQKIYPSRQVVAAIIPDLLSLLPSETALNHILFIHDSFLASSLRLPSNMRPDPLSHLPFIRFIGRKYGSREAEEFVRSLTEKRVSVGAVGWVTVAVHWAKAGRPEAALRILDAIGSDKRWANGVTSISTAAQGRNLTPRSYVVPAMACLKRKDKKGAALILEGMTQRWPELRTSRENVPIAEDEVKDGMEEESQEERIASTG